MSIKPQGGQERLIAQVFDQGLCVQCGACIGLCPYFEYFDGKVVVLDQCHAETWKCLQVCPQANYEQTSPVAEAFSPTVTPEPIGSYQSIFMARAIDEETRRKAQYGGVVSALLIYALKKGDIKSAVLTDAGDSFSPAGTIARTRRDVLECASSRYSGSASLSALNRALRNGENKIGVVGLPCQLEALARLRLMKPEGEKEFHHISLKIGLFCTWALDYRQLAAFLKRKGVRSPVQKFDIPPPPSEQFKVKHKRVWKDFPLPEIRPLIQKGCALCQDMTAKQADISIGTVEGIKGWNTVIVRTKPGVLLVSQALKEGWIETRELPQENFEHLKEAAQLKCERGTQARIDMGPSLKQTK